MKPVKYPIILAIVLSIFAAASVSQADEFSADSIKNIAKKCARHRLGKGVNNLNDPNSYYGTSQYNWDIGAYMTGIMALYRLVNEQWVLDSATKWANNANWTPDGGINATGDAQCCEQAFCEMYLLTSNPANLTKMAKPTLDNMKQMYDVNRSTGRVRWWWSDALYMSPPSLARVFQIYETSDPTTSNRLLDSMTKYWKDCAAYLYNTQYHLWWRDGTVINSHTANGSLVFWSGCNAWAIAGLARVLQSMPADYKDRPYFVQQFKDVCNALRTVPALGTDGLWRTSLLDYNQYPEKESIASAFFGFAFLWGIDNGLLDRATYEPLARKTWSALVANIGSNGMLQWCQTVASGPGDIGQNFSAAEGEGAFCLMAEELTKFLFSTPVNPSARPQLSSRDMGASRMSLVSRNGKVSVQGSGASAAPVALYDVRGKFAGTAGASAAGALPVGVYAVKNAGKVANVK
jgi:unsaturated rhamnogalacturonyl hydrolase